MYDNDKDKIIFDKNELDKALEQHRLSKNRSKTGIVKKLFRPEPPSCYLTGPPLDSEDDQEIIIGEPSCYMGPAFSREDKSSNAYKRKKFNEWLKLKKAGVDVPIPNEDDDLDEPDGGTEDE
jgi:hypothetical protein